jgi:hypothetical protein
MFPAQFKVDLIIRCEFLAILRVYSPLHLLQVRCHMDLQRLDQEHKDLATRYKKATEQVKILQSRIDIPDPVYAPQVGGREETGVYRQLLEVERETGRQNLERLAQQDAVRMGLEDKLAATRSSLAVATSQVIPMLLVSQA